jgi:hypothetical protein
MHFSDQSHVRGDDGGSPEREADSRSVDPVAHTLRWRFDPAHRQDRSCSR